MPDTEKAKAVQKEVSTERMRAWHGRRVEVLVEGPSKRDETRYTGRSRPGHIAAFPARPDLVGVEVAVDVTGSTALTLFGTLASPSPGS